MATTYTPIATTTLTSTTTQIDFTGISSAYNDLVITTTHKLAADDLPYIVVGDGTVDTGSNYSFTWMRGNGNNGTVTAGGSTSNTRVYLGYSNVEWAMSTAHIMNYANTSVFKSMINKGGDSWYNGVTQYIGIWRSTSAINTVSIRCGSAFQIGSTFTIHGIAKA